MLAAPAAGTAQNAGIEARFRGCEAAGWCRFAVEAGHTDAIYRVRPDGARPFPDDPALAVALRDRLNALLSSMIHQHKRIELHDLRALEDGTFEASVTVNGVGLAQDPALAQLMGWHDRAPR